MRYNGRMQTLAIISLAGMLVFASISYIVGRTKGIAATSLEFGEIFHVDYFELGGVFYWALIFVTILVGVVGHVPLLIAAAVVGESALLMQINPLLAVVTSRIGRRQWLKARRVEAGGTPA